MTDGRGDDSILEDDDEVAEAARVFQRTHAQLATARNAANDADDFIFMPQYIEFTPEEDAALDAYWAEEQAQWSADHYAEAEAVVDRYRANGEMDLYEHCQPILARARALIAERGAPLAPLAKKRKSR